MSAESLKNSVQIEWKDSAPCARKAEVKIAKESVDTVFNDALKEAAKHVQLPGFRKGKAPLSMVKSRYSDYITDDVAKMLQSAAFEKIAEDKTIDMVSFGSPENAGKPEAGKDYTFSLEIEIAPEITLPEYKSISVEVEKGESVESRVEARVKYLKDLYADYITLEEPAAKGDMLKVSYESDFVLPENAPATLARSVKSEESWLWLNEPEQIPGALKALVGAVKGGSYEFKAEFPADWREAELAGKSVTYKVKVHEVQRRVAIESEEKLAEKLNAGSVEKFREDIRKSAEKEQEHAQKEQVRGKILEVLMNTVPEFKLPAGVLNSTTEKEFSRIAEKVVRSESDVEKFKSERDQHLESAKKAAETYLRRFFVLRKIARAESITVDPAEIDQQISNMSSYLGYKEKEVRKMLERNGGIGEIQADMLMGKVLDFISEKVKVA